MRVFTHYKVSDCSYGGYMNVGKALLMGLIQGLTEFLPVSSSGHLALIKQIFKMDTDSGILFDVLLHVATLIAICGVYFKDVARLFIELIGIIRDVFKNIVIFFKSMGSVGSKDFIPIMTSSYRRFAALVIISTIPTGILGILLDDIVDYSSGNLLVTGICLIGTGIILLISTFFEGGEKKPKNATIGDAFSIGCAQGIATLPGLSRSGTTITAALLCGFDRKFAVKYSFIMSIPAILGALLLELTKLGGSHVTGGEVGCYFLGMIVALVVGFFALLAVMKLIMSKYFKYFSFYCLGLGLISIIVFLIIR